MLDRRNKIIRIAILSFIGVLIYFIWGKAKNSDQHDWKEIEKSGVIHISTSYNAIDYFFRDDSIQGFQYEVIQAIFKDKPIEPIVTPVVNFSDQLSELLTGHSDLIASSLPVSSDLKELVNFTSPILKNRQVLVQRKDSTALADTIFLDNQVKLGKKNIYVVKNSPAILRLKNLSNEIADTIYIHEVERYGQEQLIAMVAHGDIDYAICDERIATLALDSIPHLDIELAIGFTQLYSWAVNKDTPELLDSLNTWIEQFTNSPKYQEIYSKYYKNKDLLIQSDRADK